MIPAFANDRSPLPLPVSILNATSRSWPGLDVQREGLVELRYSFTPTSRQDRSVVDDSAPLDVDMLAGERTAALAHLKPPAQPGEYLLEVGLVQRVGDAQRHLPLRTRRAVVEVVP